MQGLAGLNSHVFAPQHRKNFRFQTLSYEKCWHTSERTSQAEFFSTSDVSADDMNNVAEGLKVCKC